MQEFMAQASLRLDSVEQLLSGEMILTPKEIFTPKQSPNGMTPCKAEYDEDAEVSLLAGQ